jgi:hypothetical protein
MAVAHTCNPCNSSYSGGRDEEDLSSSPAPAKSSQDLNSTGKAGCDGIHLSSQLQQEV